MRAILYNTDATQFETSHMRRFVFAAKESSSLSTTYAEQVVTWLEKVVTSTPCSGSVLFKARVLELQSKRIVLGEGKQVVMWVWSSLDTVGRTYCCDVIVALGSTVFLIWRFTDFARLEILVITDTAYTHTHTHTHTHYIYKNVRHTFHSEESVKHQNFRNLMQTLQTVQNVLSLQQDIS
jgi:hypothetical protein